MKKSFIITTLISLFLTLSGCVDGNLHKVIDPETEEYKDRISAKGDLCSIDPDFMISPVKILFVVDCSSSMLWTDPDNYAQTAVEGIIDRFSDNDEYYFGLITFNTEVHLRTAGFTQDDDELAEALTHIGGVPDSDTHTKEAAWMARDTILDDIDASTEGDELERTRYIVIFLSDGVPWYAEDHDPDNFDTRATELLNAVDDLMDIETDPDIRGIGGLVTHSAFLGISEEDSDYPGAPSYEAAVGLMEDIADHGRGQYVRFYSAEEIDFSMFDYNPLRISFEIVSLIVSNSNVRIGKIMDPETGEETLGMLVDSDGDGLSDEEENILGTDPTHPDSDGDGCNDFVENFRGLDPLFADCICTDIGEDDDLDGLTNCDEAILFTNQYNFDTDLDGFIDSLEVLAGTDPDRHDKYDDRDGDGRANGSEIRLHTNPKINDYEIFEKRSYVYNMEENLRTVDGRYCYTVKVENITVLKTIPLIEGLPSFNTIKFYLIQRPQDDSQETDIFSVGSFDVRVYDDGEVVDGEIDLNKIEFVNAIP